ncbi:hypothetical protein [Cupriavidus sp. D39]|uniref:hypothetical protein n=1 Tax=Cupriavidus sp. D39 TaxID=2997877 RepID=UPI00226E0531|nr:hypothetical protein [Cupriavidus sp. D39]MCY0853017.1 hypothetical protein [Cupriavidus sp. D39]
MSQLDKALTVLIERDPTTEEIAKFYQIKEACGFSEHDSVWSLILAFGHYEILYKDIADKIGEQSIKTLADHKLALDSTAAAAERAIKSNLVDSVRETTSKLLAEAQKTGTALAAIQAKKGLLIGAVTSLGVATVLLLCAGFLGYSIGSKSAGPAAAWLQTADGAAAQRFAQMNAVRTMLDCPAPYQTHREGSATYCVPFDPQAKKTWGWRIN